MRKHTYTRELAPTNTGSITRPARLNLRQTVEVHARTHKAFCELRELIGMPRDTDYATIFERALLPALEHIIWNIREAPRGTRNMMLDLFRPLAREDWARARYASYKERFERGEKKPNITRSLLPGFEVCC